MPFNEEEKRIILYGKTNGKSLDEVKQALIKYRSGVRPEQPTEKKSSGIKDVISKIPILPGTTIGDIPETIETVKNLGGKLKERAENFGGAYQDSQTGKQSPISAGVQMAGQLAGGVQDVISSSVGLGAKNLFNELPESVRSGISEQGKQLLQTKVGQFALGEISKGVEAWEAYKEAHPEAASNIEAVVNIGSLLPIGAGGKIGVEATEQGLRAVAEGVESGVRATSALGRKAISGVKSTVEPITNVAKATKEIVEAGAEGMSRIPSRLKTNVAKIQADRKAITELSTETAKKAVQDGIDITDVKEFTRLTQDKNPATKELIETVKKFSSGDKTTDPIEVVGKNISNAVKKAEAQRSVIGKQLGEVANDLGVVTKEEVTTPVFNEIKQVQGLGDVTVDKNGILNFRKTTLSQNKSAQREIQKFYTEATKWGEGKKKHVLRQELFEVLGGKKRSLSEITDTEEKAYEAIRKGLSDVLESKNNKYKTLSNDYRKLSQPLQELRKLSKTGSGDLDILDEKFGLLARRLTSNASSRPELKSALRSLDEAIGGTGAESTEKMQELYNLLEKYYDITSGTSLKGQTSLPMSAKSFLLDKAESIIGSTDAVKKKALEDLLEELLKTSEM